MADPSQIAGLTLWLDAAAITGLSDGEYVDVWPDRSGNGYDADGISTNLHYHTGELNGKPIVRFGGNPGAFRIPITGPGGDELTTFVVAKSTTSLFGYQSLIRYQGGITSPHWVYPWGGSAILLNSDDADIPSGLKINEWNIGVSRRTRNTTPRGVITHRNGAIVEAAATTDVPLPSGLDLWVGGRNHSGEVSNCDVAELLIYNAALTDAEIRDVEIYLADKWGLRSSLAYEQRLRDVTDLALALDATVPESITHLDNVVSQIDDLSGNGRHFTSGGGLEPVWTGSELQFTSPTTLTRTGQGDMNLPKYGDWALCMKLRLPDTAFRTNQFARFHSHYDAISNNVMTRASSTSLQTWITNQRLDHSGLYTDLAHHTFTIGRQAGVRFLRTDGVLWGTPLASTTAIGQTDFLQFGINRLPFNHADFSLQRVAIYHGPPTSVNLRQIESWVETGSFQQGPRLTSPAALPRFGTSRLLTAPQSTGRF